MTIATLIFLSLAVIAGVVALIVCARMAKAKETARLQGECYRLQHELDAALNRESLEKHRATNCENRYQMVVAQNERLRREQYASTKKRVVDGSDADATAESMRVLGYGTKLPATSDDHSDSIRAAAVSRDSSGVAANPESAGDSKRPGRDREP